jgi:hypothetical protein
METGSSRFSAVLAGEDMTGHQDQAVVKANSERCQAAVAIQARKAAVCLVLELQFWHQAISFAKTVNRPFTQRSEPTAHPLQGELMTMYRRGRLGSIDPTCKFRRWITVRSQNGDQEVLCDDVWHRLEQAKRRGPNHIGWEVQVQNQHGVVQWVSTEEMVTVIPGTGVTALPEFVRDPNI